jgi:hypothetical protein
MFNSNKKPRKSRLKPSWIILKPTSRSAWGTLSIRNQSKTKNKSPAIDGIIVCLFLLLLRAQEAKCLDLGRGRFWIDFGLILIHPVSVCLPICTADIQRPLPNKEHFQICTSITSYRRCQDAHLKLHSSTQLVFDRMSGMIRIRCSNHNPKHHTYASRSEFKAT